MTRIYPPKIPLAPSSRVYPPVKTPDYWNSIKYRLDNADTITASAGITATQLGNGDIQIDVAAGKTPDANPSSGFTLAWKMKESVSGRVIDYTLPGNYQGIINSWLGVVSGLGGGNGIELSIGVANAPDLLSSSSLAASINDVTNKPVAAWRFIAPSNFARSVDANATNLSTAVLLELSKNVGSGTLFAGGSPVAIGSSTLDPRMINPPGSPFDVTTGAGSVNVGKYLIVNIRNASLSNIPSNRTYVIRPKFLLIDWSGQ